MAKFMLLYVGPATPPADMSPEATKQVMDAWNQWIGEVGDNMVDVGSPTANGQAVVDDGSSGTASELNGYSIIEASDMESALKAAKMHPFLSAHNGKFRVEVFELLPAPM